MGSIKWAYLALAVSISLGIGSSAFAAEKPLVFVFQKQKNPAEIETAAKEVSAYLSKELGREVVVQVPSDYSATVQALVSKKADFAYTSSLPFLLARRDGGASILLAEQRTDNAGNPKTDYESVMIVRSDSPISSIKDVAEKAKDLRFVFASSTSTSGYVFASLRLVRENILTAKQNPKDVFKSASYAGSYTQALEEVLAGRGDIAAVSFYAVEGPDSSKYLPKEEIAKLRVIARTPGVPTHIISARGGLDENLKKQATMALLKMSEERPELLNDVYGASKFVEVDETEHLANTLEALSVINTPITGLVPKKEGSSITSVK